MQTFSQQMTKRDNDMEIKLYLSICYVGIRNKIVVLYKYQKYF